MIAKASSLEGLGKFPKHCYLLSIHANACPMLLERFSVPIQPRMEFYADRDAKSRKPVDDDQSFKQASYADEARFGKRVKHQR
ncbi:MAG: hypothetical protein ACK5EO_07565 [Planctomycetota bacterium]|jgi:hypothetical protein